MSEINPRRRTFKNVVEEESYRAEREFSFNVRSPERTPVISQMETFTTTQKAQLIYKLFMLESARNTVEEQLYFLLQKVYDEVQEVFHSTFPNSVLTTLSKELDVKFSVLKNFSALLRDLTTEGKEEVGLQPVIQKGMRRNNLQPLRLVGVLQTDAVTFGPMLTNSLMVTSISKAVQVLGAMQSLQQLKLCLTSSSPIVSQDYTKSSTASDTDITVLPTSTPCSLKTETKEAVFDENSKEDKYLIQTLKPSAVPQKPATLPESGGFKPTSISPLKNWKRVDNVQVPHHRQTSHELLHFLRKNTRNISAVQDRFRECNRNTRALEVLEPSEPAIKRRHSSHVVNRDKTIGVVSEMSKKNRDNQAPVLSFKKRESHGLITYSCVITTETELWDIIDIPIVKSLGRSELSHLEGNECSKTIGQVADFTVNSHGTTQPVKSAQPDPESISLEAKTQTFDSVNMIPQFQIRKFEEAEVVVSHIVTPGNFYIQYVDWEEKLQSLITESFKASSSYAEKKSIPDLGTLVMAWFPTLNKWCRAQVMKICGVCRDNNVSDSVENRTSIVVEVKRLDHGDAACLSLSNIKQLTHEMTVLPLQAVQVSLANVVPVTGNGWSQQSVSWFTDVVHDRTLYARLYPHGTNITVELFLEKGKLGAMRRGASLSLRLAQNGHAKHSELMTSGLRKRSSALQKAQKQNPDLEEYLYSIHRSHHKSVKEPREDPEPQVADPWMSLI